MTADSKNSELGNNPLSSISNNALTADSNRIRNALKNNNNNTMKKTKRSLLKGRKKFAEVFPRNNELGNNPFSGIRKSDLTANSKGNKLKNNEQKKARLIEVQNEEGNTVWIDPKNNSVYLNSNATISTPALLGGVENTNSNNPENKGKLWYRKKRNTNSKYLKMTRENYNSAKAKVTRKNRRNTRATRKTRAQRK